MYALSAILFLAAWWRWDTENKRKYLVARSLVHLIVVAFEWAKRKIIFCDFKIIRITTSDRWRRVFDFIIILIIIVTIIVLFELQ